MLHTDWPDAWRGAFRAELRAQAVDLAIKRWPVFPGTYPTGSAWAGPVPATDEWRTDYQVDPDRIAAWWHEQPYSVLVATGTVVDAVEVDDELGRKAACLLRAEDRPAPILALPNGKWVFLTQGGSELPAELAERPGVRLHSAGGWIPLPPSPWEHGIVHWRVKPEMWGWQLPHAGAVHGVLTRALRELAEGHTPQMQASAA